MNLEGDDQRLYELITRRFLACVSQDALGHETSVDIDIAAEIFSAKGLVVLAQNYLDVYPYDRWSGTNIPPFAVAERLQPSELVMNEGTTTQPQLLTEADLIGIMDRNGIGTDATIHEHIKKILEREYADKATGRFTPTTLGIALVEGYDRIGFESSLSKPYLRREMEVNMRKICDGTRTKEDVVRDSIEMYRLVFLKAVREAWKMEESLVKWFQHPPERAG